MKHEGSVVGGGAGDGDEDGNRLQETQLTLDEGRRTTRARGDRGT